MIQKILFISLFCFCAAAAFTQPAISFEEEVFNFEEMDEGGVLDLEFKFKNNGTDTLIIKQIRPDCGCTTPKLDQKRYKPGEEGTIQVKFSSHNLGGRVVSKRIQVSSNDPARGFVTLRIKGKIRLKFYAKLNLVPMSLRFGRVEVGDVLKQTITISNSGTIPLKIMEFSHSPEIVPEIDVISIEPQSKGEIRITYKPLKPGDFTTYLKIRSNSHREYMKVVKITARVGK